MPDHWHQAEELYHAVLERPADERQAFLLEATAGDDALRREVQFRLAQEASTQSSVELRVSRTDAQEHSGERTKSTNSTLSEIADPLIGKLVSHYRILQMVGAGGMGMVYRVHDERLDRDVALKVLPPWRLGSDAARDRFRTEALALAKLNHAHIGAIYDFDREEGLDFLVMEYVPGHTLAQQLASGPLSEDEILNLTTQIVAAMAEAHGKGIVHRDLKPSNIMVTPSGQAKVLDFGVAKLLQPGTEILPIEELRSAEHRAGTLPYMAPEQLRGVSADTRTDIYGVGTVLYEMATGRRPFPANSARSLASDIQAQPPTPPRQLNSKLSKELEQTILKCLEKKPEDRYQSANELLADLERLRKPAKSSRSRRALLASSLIAVLLAVAYSLWKPPQPPPKPGAEKVILSVLPFKNLSGDPQEDYLCDGLTEEMINRLGRMMPQYLGVTARTSVMPYKNTDKTVGEIGRELGSSYILETSVQRDSKQVRISTQLIQVRDQTSLWTQSYEYDLAGVLALESDVAERVAHSLALKLLPDQTTPSQTTNADAYEAYLRGLYHWHKGSAEERQRARESFEESVQADPKFAPAYAGLASYYSVVGDLRPNVAIPKAKEYALKALALDDSLTQAHTALGGIRFYGEWDWPGAESEFKRALQLNPNDAEAHRNYSNYLLALGRFDEALAEVQRALELDPLSLLLTNVNKGWSFYFARQYERAIDQCKQALELDANSDGAHACLGWSYLGKGMYEEALAESQRAASLSGRNPARLAGLARAYAADGKKDEAERILAELSERAKHGYVSSYLFARIHMALGQTDQVLADLNQAYTERDPFMVWLNVDDTFDALRTDARFKNLLRRVGFLS